MLYPRSTGSRRLVMPLVILIVGGSLAIWAAQRENQKLNDIRLFVTALCSDVARGDDVTARIQSGGYTVPGLEESLHLVCDGLAEYPGLLTVVVEGGDTSGLGNSLTTHHATIRVAEIDRLGLRLIVQGDDIQIIGYWFPDPVMPPP